MRSFDFYVPSTIEEAVNLLEELEGDTRLLAGGTDLLIQLKRRVISPKSIINLKKVAELNYLEEKTETLSIGALTLVGEIEYSQLIRTKAGVLAQAAAKLGSRQIRNLATIGGNICNAVPSAEMAPPLLILNAQVHMQGRKGKRSIPIEEFFIGPRVTLRRSNEILVGFTCDKYTPATKAVYLRYTRRKAMDIAVASVAVKIDLALDGITVQSARIALGAVAPIPIRISEAEKLLIGKPLTSQIIAKAGTVAAEIAHPITDSRASADYRRRLVDVLTVQALDQITKDNRSH